MEMRDWELIANVHGEENRERGWIEDYLVREGGCDKLVVRSLLSRPGFILSKFPTYAYTLLSEASTAVERDSLIPKLAKIREHCQPCRVAFLKLLDTPEVKLVNAIALANWVLFIRPRNQISYRLYNDKQDSPTPAIAGRFNLCFWRLDGEGEKNTILWGLNVRWHLPNWQVLAVELDLGGIENALTLHAGVPLIELAVQLEEVPQWIQSWLPENGRTLGIRIHHQAIWIDLFSEAHIWTPRDWTKIVIHPLDFLLGCERATIEQVGEQPVEIHLDGRIYSGTARKRVYTWTRPRWFKKTRHDVDIRVEEGIPVPGKGESEWDCGEDSFSAGGTSTTDLSIGWDTLVFEAITRFKQRVEERRRRHGGANWEPTAVQVARSTGTQIVES
jgi:hypothetical protein